MICNSKHRVIKIWSTNSSTVQWWLREPSFFGIQHGPAILTDQPNQSEIKWFFVGHADPLHHQRLDMEKHHLCLSHGVFKMLPGEGTQVEQLKNSYGYDLIVEFNIRSSSFHSNAWGYHICRASVIGHKLAPQNFTKWVELLLWSHHNVAGCGIQM